MMRLFLVCACARALAPPGRTLVGGTWAGWQREFDVDGGTAPAGYELTSSERLDGDVLEANDVKLPEVQIDDDPLAIEIEDISLVDWVKREGKMEIPADLDHGLVEDEIE